jgi:hypothetical protein
MQNGKESFWKLPSTRVETALSSTGESEVPGLAAVSKNLLLQQRPAAGTKCANLARGQSVPEQQHTSVTQCGTHTRERVERGGRGKVAPVGGNVGRGCCNRKRPCVAQTRDTDVNGAAAGNGGRSEATHRQAPTERNAMTRLRSGELKEQETSDRGQL